MDRNPTQVGAAPAEATRQLVVCALGAEQYGLPIAQVREIVRFTAPRPVASELPWMRGVIGLRGRLVPVYDLAVRLGVAVASAGSAPSETAKIVIVEVGAQTVGLLVDDVVEVLTVAEAQLEDVPSGSGQIVRLGDRLVLLLDGADLAAS